MLVNDSNYRMNNTPFLGWFPISKPWWTRLRTCPENDGETKGFHPMAPKISMIFHHYFRPGKPWSMGATRIVFMGFINQLTRPGKRWKITNWKDPPFSSWVHHGKSTISTGPFSISNIQLLGVPRPADHLSAIDFFGALSVLPVWRWLCGCLPVRRCGGIANSIFFLLVPFVCLFVCSIYLPIYLSS